MEKGKILDDKCVSFIKLLHPQFSNQLQIPSDFISMFNGSGNVPHRFIIESTTTKKCWRVEVEEDEDGMFYFRDGWAAFAEAHCLQVGNFLVFQYSEQSIFQVKIYDKNGCEQNTFLNQKDTQPSTPTVIIDVQDEEIRIINSLSDEGEPKMSKKTRQDDRSRRLALRKDNNGNRTKQMHNKLSNVGDNKSSFSVRMAKQYQFYQQTFPSAVAIEKKLASKEELVLQDPEGKCWPVKLAHKKSGLYTLLVGRWKRFLDGNNVVIGDTLNFEFLSDNLVQVHVTRRSQRADHHFKAKSRTKDTKLLDMEHNNGNHTKQNSFSKTYKRLSNVGDNNSSFSVLMAKQYQFYKQTFPTAVAIEKNLASKEEVVLQDNEGNCWSIRLGHRKSGYVLLVGGWKNFLEENNIVIGDIINFRFVSEKLVKVHIQRGADHDTVHIDSECDMMQDNESDAAAIDQTIEGSVAPKEVECELRQHTSFAFPWNKSKAIAHLYIPKAIAKEQQLKNKENIALRDTNGKYWPLEVKTWRNGQVCLTKGWVEFWKGLEIEDGDTLEFEFVTNRRMQVNIHRHEQPRETNAEEPIVDMEVMNIEEPTSDIEVMDIKGTADDLMDSTADMEGMNIKGFANDLLASNRDHCFPQTPPGFKPLEHHVL